MPSMPSLDVYFNIYPELKVHILDARYDALPPDENSVYHRSQFYPSNVICG